MPENSTLKCDADCIADTNEPLQPKASTIENILRFAATYQVAKTKDGHFIETVLN